MVLGDRQSMKDRLRADGWNDRHGGSINEEGRLRADEGVDEQGVDNECR